jgi:hypothetical protein
MSIKTEARTKRSNSSIATLRSSRYKTIAALLIVRITATSGEGLCLKFTSGYLSRPSE